jgi:hypothetical protein
MSRDAGFNNPCWTQPIFFEGKKQNLGYGGTNDLQKHHEMAKKAFGGLALERVDTEFGQGSFRNGVIYTTLLIDKQYPPTYPVGGWPFQASLFQLRSREEVQILTAPLATAIDLTVTTGALDTKQGLSYSKYLRSLKILQSFRAPWNQAVSSFATPQYCGSPAPEGFECDEAPFASMAEGGISRSRIVDQGSGFPGSKMGTLDWSGGASSSLRNSQLFMRTYHFRGKVSTPHFQ